MNPKIYNHLSWKNKQMVRVVSIIAFIAVAFFIVTMLLNNIIGIKTILIVEAVLFVFITC